MGFKAYVGKDDLNCCFKSMFFVVSVYKWKQISVSAVFFVLCVCQYQQISHFKL